MATRDREIPPFVVRDCFSGACRSRNLEDGRELWWLDASASGFDSPTFFFFL